MQFTYSLLALDHWPSVVLNLSGPFLEAAYGRKTALCASFACSRLQRERCGHYPRSLPSTVGSRGEIYDTKKSSDTLSFDCIWNFVQSQLDMHICPAHLT